MSLVIPEPGQVVRVRSRQYLVEDVERTYGEERALQTRVAISCIDEDAQGVQTQVLWETELDAQIVAGTDWHKVAERGFDSPRLFGAYLNTLRWNLVTSTTPRLFQSPWRAGIEVMSYQLEPLKKALALPRVNLFIADDVGLGKTIEAGLILRELLLRQKVKRVVVAAPPSVVPQWRDELENRFGLSFVIFDREYVHRRRKERGFAANPWKSHTRFIVSHALLRDEQYAAPLRDWLGSFAAGSMLILDEAHHAAPSSSSKYAIDSQFTRGVREVARRFEHRLFLSATPHNGHSNSFAALLEILDPQRFCRGVKVTKGDLDTVMVRRLKSDLRAIGAGDFPERKVRAIPLDGLSPDTPELRLAELLEAYRVVREKRIQGLPPSLQNAAKLVIIGLQKRLFSSIEAFACSLRAHRRGLERRQAKEDAARTRRGKQLVSEVLFAFAPGADDDEGDLDEETQSQDALGAMEDATALVDEGVALADEERALLDQMTAIAEQSRGLPDARVRHFIGWLKEHLCPDLGKPGAVWADKRVLIFTEWLDTKRYLMERLAEACGSSAEAEKRVRFFHGGMGDDAREEVKQAFNGAPSKHPLRILVATDAAREGVNLQNHCADLFHFDLPWNPARLEQRNGRIDRKLQRASEVRCHYYIYTQRPEDRVLDTLVKKTERIQRELGSQSQVLHAQIASRLEGKGFARPALAALQNEIEHDDIDAEKREAVSVELESARAQKSGLTENIASLSAILDESKRALGFDVEAFRDALSCSLELLGAPELIREEIDDDPRTKEFRFPDLDRLAGASPTWAATLDTLRPPRERAQKLWEWRKTARVRPVVFHDTGRVEENFVHLHLEHRVVQRLLARFLAQGFVHNDLSRANVLFTDDGVKRVVVLGKLALYGDGASRLHEELVPVTARWAPRDARRGPLEPYAKDAEAKTLDVLYAALRDTTRFDVPESTRQLLATHLADDVGALLPALEARAKDAEHMARKRLGERAARESKNMREILVRQKGQIEKELKSPQLELSFSSLEKKQLEEDRTYWQKRLREIDDEMVREPARIEQAYDVKLTRTDPVGVVYLWPRAG